MGPRADIRKYQARRHGGERLDEDERLALSLPGASERAARLHAIACLRKEIDIEPDRANALHRQVFLLRPGDRTLRVRARQLASQLVCLEPVAELDDREPPASQATPAHVVLERQLTEVQRRDELAEQRRRRIEAWGAKKAQAQLLGARDRAGQTGSATSGPGSEPPLRLSIGDARFLCDWMEARAEHRRLVDIVDPLPVLDDAALTLSAAASNAALTTSTTAPPPSGWPHACARW